MIFLITLSLITVHLKAVYGCSCVEYAPDQIPIDYDYDNEQICQSKFIIRGTPTKKTFLKKPLGWGYDIKFDVHLTAVLKGDMRLVNRVGKSISVYTQSARYGCGTNLGLWTSAVLGGDYANFRGIEKYGFDGLIMGECDLNRDWSRVSPELLQKVMKYSCEAPKAPQVPVVRSGNRGFYDNNLPAIRIGPYTPKAPVMVPVVRTGKPGPGYNYNLSPMPKGPALKEVPCVGFGAKCDRFGGGYCCERMICAHRRPNDKSGKCLPRGSVVKPEYKPRPSQPILWPAPKAPEDPVKLMGLYDSYRLPSEPRVLIPHYEPIKAKECARFGAECGDGEEFCCEGLHCIELDRRGSAICILRDE